MCAIIEDLVPASYFSTTLIGVQTDQRVLRHLIVQYLPRLDKLLQEHDIGESSPLPKKLVPPWSHSCLINWAEWKQGCVIPFTH